jgi:hypothetical protein
VELLDDVLLARFVAETEPLVELVTVDRVRHAFATKEAQGNTRKHIAYLLGVAEDVGHEKVQERPQLPQVVLQRGPRDEKAEVCVHLPDRQTERRLLVLDAMGLAVR